MKEHINNPRSSRFRVQQQLLDDLAAELVREIRGSESQMQLSERLGYSFNQVAKWETGKKRVLWRDFLALAKLKKAPIHRALAEAYLPSFEEPDSTKILADLQGPLSVSDFARRVQKGRLRVARWLNGDVEISLAELMGLFHESRNNLPSFLAALVPLDRLPSGRKIFGHRASFHELVLERPWIVILQRFLSHPDCPTHDKAADFLARQLGLSVTEVEQTIRILQNNQLLFINSENYLEPEFSRVVMPASINDYLRKYWLEISHQLLNRGLDDENLAGYLVFSVGEDVWPRIVTQYREFLGNIRAIIDADHGRQSKFKLLTVKVADLENIGEFVNIKDPDVRDEGLTRGSS